jgi:hypothetical protein
MILSPLWLPITLAAALFQCWRTALQQKLRGQLSVNGAAVVRYLYGVPVGAALLGAYMLAFGGALPPLHITFLLLCAAGGLGQILGTYLGTGLGRHRHRRLGRAVAVAGRPHGVLAGAAALHDPAGGDLRADLGLLLCVDQRAHQGRQPGTGG